MEDTFRERLAKAMKAEGVSNSILARRTGMRHTHICDILAGGRVGITIITAAKIIEALPNIDARWLLIGKLHNV